MKIVDKLEDTLNGGYRGLYAEVVTHDTYRVKNLDFQPDVVFDIGANIGIFSRFARTLFPKAKIVALEPDPENAIHFRKFTNDPNTILVEKAIGSGQVYHGLTARNGSGATYLSAGLGYPEKLMKADANVKRSMELCPVSAITLEEFIAPYYKPNLKAVMKIDCEGAENSIWSHKPSLVQLRKMDYIAMEIHWYALHGGESASVSQATCEVLWDLGKTHNCILDGVHFWGRKK